MNNLTVEQIMARAEAVAPSVGGGTETRLPSILNAKAFRESVIPVPAAIIEGVLTQGSRMLLVAPSKARKSFAVKALAYAVASGGEWLGIKTKKGRVLYVNFELREHTIHKRITAIADALHVSDDELLDIWDLRKDACSIEGLIDDIIKIIGTREKYVLIILDPSYKLLGDRDENSAGDMTEFCGHVERLAQASGAAVVATAHFPKGSAGGKSPMDRIAGSGAFARDCDAMLVLTPHDNSTEKVPVFTVDSVLREFEPLEPFVISWEYPLMTRNPELDPTQVAGGPGVDPKYSSDDLLKHVPDASADKGIAKNVWKALAAEDCGITRSSFYERVATFLQRGAVFVDAEGLIRRAAPARDNVRETLRKIKANPQYTRFNGKGESR
jgi:hypothetical protein